MAEKIKLSIQITKKCFEKLQEQVDSLLSQKDSGFFMGNETITTVEEFIEANLEQIANEERLLNIQDKMQEVLKSLNDKGLDIMEIFNSFNEKTEEKPKTEKKVVKKS